MEALLNSVKTVKRGERDLYTPVVRHALLTTLVRLVGDALHARRPAHKAHDALLRITTDRGLFATEQSADAEGGGEGIVDGEAGDCILRTDRVLQAWRTEQMRR